MSSTSRSSVHALAPLAVTIGDAAGVGPELILGTWLRLRAAGSAVVFGDPATLARALQSLAAHYPSAQLPREVRAVSEPADAAALPSGVVPVIAVPGATEASAQLDEASAYPWGRAVPAFGRLQYEALCAAIDAAMAGTVSGILTAPWHKARLADAALPPTGHTEVLTERTGAGTSVMLLTGEVLRVALATVHCPLAEVPGRLSTDGIVETAATLHQALVQDFQLSSPRIAVLGLNPHAGEGGLMGSEERDIIEPAVHELRSRGLDVVGPLPADTCFPLVAAGQLEVAGIVAMYHDQGLGPLKTFHFGEAANVTLGLPIIRTSVDHGTAYDIAGTGRVRAASFLYAASLARRLSAVRASRAT